MSVQDVFVFINSFLVKKLESQHTFITVCKYHSKPTHTEATRLTRGAVDDMLLHAFLATEWLSFCT